MTIPPTEVSVLLVDDDVQLCRSLKRLLEQVGFEVDAVRTGAEAVERIAKRPAEVVVTDLRMEGMSGLDLMERLCEISPQTRVILMSAFASSREYDAALRLGAVRVLSKPFENVEFLDAVRQAADSKTGVRGSIHGLALTDVLQMFHYGRRSVTIRVSGTTPGSIHIEKGELVHAEFGDVRGRDALKLLLSRSSGSIETTAIQTRERSLKDPFDSLLLDALREVDEGDFGAVDLALDGKDPWQDFEQTLESKTSDLGQQIEAYFSTASAWLVSKTLSEVEPLLGDVPADHVIEPVSATVAALGRIVVDWQVAECVAHGVALALLRRDDGGILVIQADTSHRRGVERFRWQLAKLKRALTD